MRTAPAGARLVTGPRTTRCSSSSPLPLPAPAPALRRFFHVPFRSSAAGRRRRCRSRVPGLLLRAGRRRVPDRVDRHQAAVRTAAPGGRPRGRRSPGSAGRGRGRSGSRRPAPDRRGGHLGRVRTRAGRRTRRPPRRGRQQRRGDDRLPRQGDRPSAVRRARRSLGDLHPGAHPCRGDSRRAVHRLPGRAQALLARGQHRRGPRGRRRGASRCLGVRRGRGR